MILEFPSPPLAVARADHAQARDDFELAKLLPAGDPQNEIRYREAQRRVEACERELLARLC
jgi:hypothetical protein